MGAENVFGNSEELQVKKNSDNPVQCIFNQSFDENTTSNLQVVSQIVPSPISQLSDNLVITSATFVNPRTIEEFRISCVISCAPELPDPPSLKEDIIYYKIDTLDIGSTRILQYFNTTADLIQQVSALGGRTLIFCVAGISRSATICIAYFMKHKGLSLLQAYNLIKTHRPKIKPNCGFFKQLIEYEKQLFGNNTVQMVYNETVRMEIPDVYNISYTIPSLIVNNRRKQNHCRN